MATKIATSVKKALTTSVLFVTGIALLFLGLIAPLALRAMLRLGEIWAFLLTMLFFAALYVLAELRQRRHARSEAAPQQFASVLGLISRRRLGAVLASGMLLVGTILHGIFVATGLLDLR